MLLKHRLMRPKLDSFVLRRSCCSIAVAVHHLIEFLSISQVPRISAAKRTSRTSTTRRQGPEHRKFPDCRRLSCAVEGQTAAQVCKCRCTPSRGDGASCDMLIGIGSVAQRPNRVCDREPAAFCNQPEFRLPRLPCSLNEREIASFSRQPPRRGPGCAMSAIRNHLT